MATQTALQPNFEFIDELVNASCSDDFTQRPTVRGNFLYIGDEKFWVRGVTYGTFPPNSEGELYPEPKTVDQDFAAIAANGMNSVRTYTVPPRWLLDCAQRNGLRVMIGIPWEQHITFLDDRKQTRSILATVEDGVRRCCGHPAVLCFSLGNEIPASIVRWHGARRIERFIRRLYQTAKAVDPDALYTYVNYPTTEYLQLPFLDIVCFNVYLESRETLEAYLQRLQNHANERPLLMGEIGLDSRRNGERKQAQVLSWQIETAFSSGCIGTFLFAWTDEWYRGGAEIEEWDFGLTTRNRLPKPALDAVQQTFAQTPFADDILWPPVSVVVCTYNGAATIRDAMEGLKNLSYPNYEVIVVNDGSTDATPEIVAEYDVRLISTDNRGLSSARNTGYRSANGSIIAYIDDDAYPDPDWLHFLALTYLNGDFAGAGGPNLAPPGNGPIADCVANAPGGPAHVLLTDTIAEHIPGCNMSFRKAALEKIGGFDPRYRAAGDDVDACWRIQEQVGEIGFCPTAIVWHHRRNSLAMYWKQQQGYGKAEALLEEKWSEKYNTMGHTSWSGRLYSKGWTVHLGMLRRRIYQGMWGSAPFQTLDQPHPNTLLSLPLMPEWYFLITFLAFVSLVGAGWSRPLLLTALPLLLISIALPVIQACISASRARFTIRPANLWHYSKLYTLTALMHLLQPLARLIGRIKHGLTPWRKRGGKVKLKIFPQTLSIWRQQWMDSIEVLKAIKNTLQEAGVIVMAGGDYDHWDLEVHGGLFGRARVRMATEEHGQGRQLNKFRLTPKFSVTAVAISGLLGTLSLLSALDGIWLANVPIAIVALLIVGRLLREVSNAMDLACTEINRLMIQAIV